MESGFHSRGRMPTWPQGVVQSSSDEVRAHFLLGMYMVTARMLMLRALEMHQITLTPHLHCEVAAEIGSLKFLGGVR